MENEKVMANGTGNNQKINKKAYKRAKHAAIAKMAFFYHVSVYVVIVGLLFVLNQHVLSYYHWAVWPAAGWAVGVVFHGISVLFYSETSSIKAKMVESEMKRVKATGMAA
jgi:hypothetical protein